MLQQLVEALEDLVERPNVIHDILFLVRSTEAHSFFSFSFDESEGMDPCVKAIRGLLEDFHTRWAVNYADLAEAVEDTLAFIDEMQRREAEKAS